MNTRKIIAILNCKTNQEYWTEIDFTEDLAEIERHVGNFILNALIQIKQSSDEDPCMHFFASAVPEEEMEERRQNDPGAVMQAQLEELMSDVESGKGSRDDS